MGGFLGPVFQRVFVGSCGRLGDDQHGGGPRLRGAAAPLRGVRGRLSRKGRPGDRATGRPGSGGVGRSGAGGGTVWGWGWEVDATLILFFFILRMSGWIVGLVFFLRMFGWRVGLELFG